MTIATPYGSRAVACKNLTQFLLVVTRFVRRLRVGPLDPGMYYGRASDSLLCTVLQYSVI